MTFVELVARLARRIRNDLRNVGGLIPRVVARYLALLRPIEPVLAHATVIPFGKLSGQAVILIIHRP